jgi:uncharacterized repeat protein (TIGR03803 family)
MKFSKFQIAACLAAALTLVASLLSQPALAQNFSVLYTFTGGTDGGGTGVSITPVLIQDNEGNLHGTTAAGGDLSCAVWIHQAGCGVVFKLDRRGNETVLHAFTGGADGNSPFGGLLRDHHGDLYSTTYYGGGPSNAGVVFKLDNMMNETVLYSFTGGADGANPASNPVRDEDDNLYGTAGAGGNLSGCNGVGCGVVYNLDPNGNESVLHSFTASADGAQPFAGLIRDEDGNLYGTNRYGRQGGGGTVYKVDRSGNLTVLHSFTGGADGGYPQTVLVRD